jgi:hypothetical protein
MEKAFSEQIVIERVFAMCGQDLEGSADTACECGCGGATYPQATGHNAVATNHPGGRVEVNAVAGDMASIRWW